MVRIFSIFIACLFAAGVISAQDKSGPKVAKRADFVSDASHVVGTYDPQTSDHSPDAMAKAGNKFIAALGEKLQTRGALSLDDKERRQWTNLPPQPNAGGVRLGEMNEAQLKATCDLMATLFSKSGYDKSCQIILGDDQLLQNGRPQQGFGTVAYAVMVFGKPSPTEPWAFQLDGHHLAVNVAIHGADVSLSPSFVGAQPEVFEIAGRKYRPFASEVDDAYALIAKLSDKQRIQAVTSATGGEIQTGAGRDGIVPEVRGVPCSGFDEAQRESLLKLISNWVGTLPPAQAEQRTKELTEELDQMHFSWNGEVAPHGDISYLIQSPSLIIEFSCQGPGDKPLDHLHSIYRDPTNEYGRQIE